MPGLRNKCVLEIDLRDSNDDLRTGVFELKEDLEDSGNISKLFLLSNRGQYFREAYDIGSEIIPDGVLDASDADNRRGYFIDGGAGTYAEQLSATAGDRDLQWGDGSTDPADPADINRYDATGCDPIAQKQIMEWYASQAKTDSLGTARLHIGEWTDGSFSSDPGVFAKPMTVAIRECNITRGSDDPGGLEVTLDLAWTAITPEAVVDEAQDLLDSIAEKMPEY